jgi:hypothetical protein
MADKNSYPLSLVLSAVDKLTIPLKRIQGQIDKVTGPARAAGNALSSLGEVAGVERLTGALANVRTATAGVFGEVERLGKRLAVVGAAAGFGLYEFVQRAVDSGAALKFQAQRLGMSTDELAGYSFAAKQAGVEQEAFTTELDFFNKTLGAVKLNTGPLFDILKNTPIALRQLQSSKTGDALQLMLHGLGKIKDDAVRSKIETLAFGKSAGAIDGLVKLGADSIQRLREEFLQLAGSQRDYAEGSVVVSKAEDRLQAAFEGTRNTLMVQMYPIITEQLARFTRFLVEHRPQLEAWARTMSESVQKAAESLPARLDRLAKVGERLRSAFEPIARLVGGWPELFATVGTLIVAGPLIGALGALTKSLMALGVAAGLTPIGWLADAVTVLAAGAVIVIENWDPIAGFFKKLWDSVQVVFQGFLDFLQGAFTRDLTKTMKGLHEIANPYAFLNQRPDGHTAAGEGQPTNGNPWFVTPNADVDKMRAAQEKLRQRDPRGFTFGLSDLQRFFAWLDGVAPDAAAAPSILPSRPIAPPAGSVLPAPSSESGAGAARVQESRVIVDIRGLPRGSRVTTAGAPVDVSVGYSSMFAREA